MYKVCGKCLWALYIIKQVNTWAVCCSVLNALKDTAGVLALGEARRTGRDQMEVAWNENMI